MKTFTYWKLSPIENFQIESYSLLFILFIDYFISECCRTPDPSHKLSLVSNATIRSSSDQLELGLSTECLGSKDSTLTAASAAGPSVPSGSQVDMGHSRNSSEASQQSRVSGYHSRQSSNGSESLANSGHFK